MPAPTSPEMQPQGPPGPPSVAFGKQRPSSQREQRAPPPQFGGVPPPNLPMFSPTPGPGRQNMQPQSFGLTSPAEIDEEPQPFGMPIPSMQAADVPATTAFGLPVPLPTPADDVGIEIGSYAAPFPPPVTAAFTEEPHLPNPARAATAFHVAEPVPVELNYGDEPHGGMSPPGLPPPPGLDLPEPPATPASGLNTPTNRNLQTEVEPGLAGNNNCAAMGGTLLLEADMASPPSTDPAAPLPPNADGVRANINLDDATARGIFCNGHEAVDDVATYTRESPAAGDLENSRPAINGGGLGNAGAASAQTLKAALQTAASAGLVMDDPTAEPSFAAEEELPQEENRAPPAQLLMSTLQLGDDDLTELLRLSLEDRPWLRTPVAEALSVLKPSRRTPPAMAPLYRESLAASTPLVESSC